VDVGDLAEDLQPVAELLTPGVKINGLDQLQMAPLVPDDSLLRFFTTQGKCLMLQHEAIFIRDK